MKNLLWLIVGGIVVATYLEHQAVANSQPIIPGLQPQGCLPGDPSVSFGGKTYCLPKGILTY